MFAKKSIKIIRLHYDELIGKIEEHEWKKYLMVPDYMLDKELGKIKKLIGIEKLDDNFGWYKILVDTDDKLSNNITLINVLI